MSDFTSYLFFIDQTGVILLNRWFDVSQWYWIYPLAILHTSAWVVLKVGFFRGCARLVQYIAARRRAKVADLPPRIYPKVWYVQFLLWLFRGIAFLARKVWQFIVCLAQRSYEGAKRAAHGKVVTSYSLFWIALTPLLQKVGDAIVGIRWKQFGWKGIWALCLGASVQTACFCLLYTYYGEERKAEADTVMYWAMFPLGMIMILTWIFKNGRSKTS